MVLVSDEITNAKLNHNINRETWMYMGGPFVLEKLIST